MRLMFALAALIASPVLADPVLADPALVSASPPEGASAARVTQIALNFSEALSAPVSGMTLVMTSMPGMAMTGPMTMSGVKVSLSPDGRSLLAATGRALPAGTYRADWHVAGKDGARVTGRLSFTAQ